MNDKVRELTKLACEVYAFHGQLGLERVDLTHCSIIRDAQNPNVWSSNFIFNITAQSADEVDALMQDVDQICADLPYRHFIIDPFTPSAVSAYLALNDYETHATTVQMVLTDDVPETTNTVSMVAVDTDETWGILYGLVRQDHQEGARTQGKQLDESVTKGIIDGYRSKSGPCQFFLAMIDDQPCAYGSGINCPNGMGMVEDLFTLPEYRGRGIASAIIAHCVQFCRNRGAGPILIGSHANEPPKYLYHRLGFQPTFLTHSFIKQLSL
ncbi:MAG: GNAT family N-acetyltransferase [Pseudomonadota bacterium]